MIDYKSNAKGPVRLARSVARRPTSSTCILDGSTRIRSYLTRISTHQVASRSCEAFVTVKPRPLDPGLIAATTFWTCSKSLRARNLPHPFCFNKPFIASIVSLHVWHRIRSHEIPRHRGKEDVWLSTLIKAISLILMHIMNEKLSKCYAEVCLNLAHTFLVPQSLILSKDVISMIQRGNR